MSNASCESGVSLSVEKEGAARDEEHQLRIPALA